MTGTCIPFVECSVSYDISTHHLMLLFANMQMRHLSQSQVSSISETSSWKYHSPSISVHTSSSLASHCTCSPADCATRKSFSISSRPSLVQQQLPLGSNQLFSMNRLNDNNQDSDVECHTSTCSSSSPSAYTRYTFQSAQRKGMGSPDSCRPRVYSHFARGSHWTEYTLGIGPSFSIPANAHSPQTTRTKQLGKICKRFWSSCIPLS